MLDFSWSEFLVVVVVAVIAIGPKQLPELLYGLGRIVRRLQYMRYAMTRQFDDFMDQNELKNLNDSPRLINPKDFDPREYDEASHDEDVMEKLPPAKTEEPKKAQND